jgi:hypothetical protein
VAGPGEELKTYVVGLQLQIPVVRQLKGQGRNVVCDVRRLDEVLGLSFDSLWCAASGTRFWGLVSREVKCGFEERRVAGECILPRERRIAETVCQKAQHACTPKP